MSQIDNKRIAKNTILLYVRTAISLLVSLITSRVTLQVLGVEDYGIQAAVGGVMAMLTIVTNSMSNSISRYITYELGTGTKGNLQNIFSTSINVQLIISLGVLIIGETLGVWFLNTQMNIPDGRMFAANWVLQFSIFSFIVGLTQTPYTAFITGYERMSVFAWFDIAETLLRLVIVYMLYISPFDKLISLAIFGFSVSVVLRFVQRFYCIRNFPECHYKMHVDRQLLKDMFGFAGWNFFTSTNYILNNQGVNILINIFFGVTANAARGIATSVESMVLKFVNNFSVAVNPQITKSYAAGELDAMYVLVCRSAKFSFLTMLLFSLPLMCEADTVLYLWLGIVPDKAPLLVQLSLVLGLEDAIGRSGYTACMATGRIKKYAIIIFWTGVLEFPLTWIAFALGAPLESTYYLYIFVKAITLMARIYLLQDMVGLPIRMYITKVIAPSLSTAVMATIPAIMVVNFMPSGFLRFLISVMVGCSAVAIFSLFVGMSGREREVVLLKAKSFIHARN